MDRYIISFLDRVKLTGKFVGCCRFYYKNCTHFGASVSPPIDNDTQGYYVLYCEGPGLPLAGVHMMSTHKMIRVLYDTRLQRAEKLSELALPTRRNFEVDN